MIAQVLVRIAVSATALEVWSCVDDGVVHAAREHISASILESIEVHGPPLIILAIQTHFSRLASVPRFDFTPKISIVILLIIT